MKWPRSSWFEGLDLFTSPRHTNSMKPLRTSIDLPRDLHRRLRGVAARRGCSARQLILRSIERLVEEEEPALPERRLPLSPPLIPPAGRRIDLTNDQIYDLIALP